MKLITDDGQNVMTKPSAVALGLFDGVHRGHQMIIGEAVKAAEADGINSAVFCFKQRTLQPSGIPALIIEVPLTFRAK